ncbi:hypothetical protein [Halalkalibacter sp. APA_J-10(15)]|uniref:hypothetical protein n=1 Tax=Halalkalibacter sp. APA_J-10(15) TaxID=2933805 RepID=UPI001FF270D8|nr:hypothetical protein [Halalkalibacter sp. APA_J-10(15)]MCK0470247.1 hypothetical protein [Halalkalibacter sp. APA_J-10(15)]
MERNVKNSARVNKYYLAEIDINPKKHQTERWSWDIYISTNDDDQYYGKAHAPGRGLEIPWTQLEKPDFLAEMIDLCEQKIPRTQ